MKKLSYLGYLILSILFLSCNTDDGLLVSLDEIVTDKEEIMLGDSILLKGENLHKVSFVFLSGAGIDIEANHLNLLNAAGKGDSRDWKENELLLYVPFYSQLLGSTVEIILDFKENISDGGLYNKYESGKKIEVSLPTIRSVSENTLSESQPVDIVLDNFNKGYEFMLRILQHPDGSNPDYFSVDSEIIGNDIIRIHKVGQAAPVILEFNIYSEDGSITRTHKLETSRSMKMHYAYNLPTDQPYAPGSFMLITGEHTNKISTFSEAKVGGYPARKGYDWPGEIGVVMPTTIPFSDGDKFEMVLPKESGYLNVDNSHNYLEFVEGKYRIVEEEQGYIKIETNVYYRTQFLNYAIVTSEKDTLLLDYLSAEEYNTSSGINHGYKLKKPTFSQGLSIGAHQLLIYTDDRKYQLKPAGDISFTMQ
ncbi:hypothetical protein SAMN05661096_03290 [Marivirga sericea]|uniref:Uncharacterized protein n=1 Tax=Marivirga sericea TaxID=1028 RepID=A0A1X7KY53_9BACT|nr:hypothetical protein [Marivirga sericea]SMG46568.1 hypothetical protein SAMN05661096_03290 [Marivirga sericea]